MKFNDGFVLFSEGNQRDAGELSDFLTRPSRYAVLSADLSSDKLVLKISGTAVEGSCPLCGHVSRRVHSQCSRGQAARSKARSTN
jgi:hypothetical protein